MDSKSLRFITHQPFFSAVRSDDLETLKNLIQNEGSDPSSLMALQNEDKATALYIAAENNFHETFIYLLSFCDLQTVMMRAKSDMDAFQVAAARGHLGCGKLKKKEDRRDFSCNGDVPLMVGQHKCELSENCKENGKTALHTTARYGQLNIVKALIERDPRIIPIKDKKGQTALHMAVKGQDTSVVDELLEADHSILNERDKKGNTALHIATRKTVLRGLRMIVTLLLTYRSIDANAINNQRETAMDIADKLQYGTPALEITEALTGRRQTRETRRSNRRSNGTQTNLVAVLVASIAFLALFNLPGQYLTDGTEAGKAFIANMIAFRVFCLLDATALFISLSVAVVQITLVAWDTRAQKQVVSVVNKLMWAACISTCGAFLSISFVVVGKNSSWIATTITALGAPILVGTLISLCYFVFRQHFGIFVVILRDASDGRVGVNLFRGLILRIFRTWMIITLMRKFTHCEIVFVAGLSCRTEFRSNGKNVFS
ncbi:hypothetical protein DH2020_043979 [Rehmannia glutinosa]|uniref:PGG domain-containing protein n=1 Tax=Rehmannia glutinosa TaxID=99300 RepID=A0ABR0UI72_REHGL